MSYEFYKIAHLFSIGVFLTAIGALFWRKDKLVIMSILMGVTTLVILVSGMGLIARIGISHGEGWPAWLQAKLAIWAILGIGAPIVLKRFVNFKSAFYWIVLVFYFLAIYLANTKIESFF
jgi:uncharacterized membrane protein SirB2